MRAIFVNCEENSILVRVVQQGGAACHDGYRSCYYRRLLPDDSYQIVAERVFDPAVVYTTPKSTMPIDENKEYMISEPLSTETRQQLGTALRQLYGVYIYLRDHDLSEESNTSRLLQERSQSYLVSRLADELQELADVQSGEHVHAGRQPDTILEGSQVGYWLFLLASASNLPFTDFAPHNAMINGYSEPYSDGKVIELRQECLSLLASNQPTSVIKGLQLGFALIGLACAQAGVSPLAPAEFDLDQMRRKGLVG